MTHTAQKYPKYLYIYIYKIECVCIHIPYKLLNSLTDLEQILHNHSLSPVWKIQAAT